MLLKEVPLFEAESQRIKAQRRAGVPYLLTDGCAAAARDPQVVDAVASILGTRDLVMWGANIRLATPNEAHLWHVDLESSLWPTVTVAVGIAGCNPKSATWCIPGTQRLTLPPPAVGDGPDNLAQVLAAAKSLGLPHATPQQIENFGDGRFYLFNANVWHRGDPAASWDRVALFMHYQRAQDRRIPEMWDHRMREWSSRPAPYMALNAASKPNTATYRPPWRHRYEAFRRRWAQRLSGNA